MLDANDRYGVEIFSRKLKRVFVYFEWEEGGTTRNISAFLFCGLPRRMGRGVPDGMPPSSIVSPSTLLTNSTSICSYIKRGRRMVMTLATICAFESVYVNWKAYVSLTRFVQVAGVLFSHLQRGGDRSSTTPTIKQHIRATPSISGTSSPMYPRFLWKLVRQGKGAYAVPSGQKINSPI